MPSPLRLPLLVAAMATLAACGRALPRSGPATVTDAPPAAAASDFSAYDLDARWRDQGGRERDLRSLAGRVQVLAMVYTGCTHTCPAIIAELKRLEAAVPAAERGRVGFVLVSLDPEHDTPERLARFAGTLRLDPARWTLLTGDAGAVRELAAVLGIRYRPEADAQISHSNTYLVLDQDGRILHRQDGVGSDIAPVLATLRAAATPVAR